MDIRSRLGVEDQDAIGPPRNRGFTSPGLPTWRLSVLDRVCPELDVSMFGHDRLVIG
jgi:hypothetical protein